MTTLFGTNGKLIAKAGEGKTLLGYLLEAAEGMRQVESCLCYVVGTSPEEQDSVYVYEVWTSEAAHKASLELPTVKALIAKAMPIIAGMENQPDLVIHGGKASLAS